VNEFKAKAVSATIPCTTLQFGVALLDEDNEEAHKTP